jgi:hypothetical protein
LELRILEKAIGRFKVERINGQIAVVTTHELEGSSTIYGLVSFLSEGFPDEKPRLYLAAPNPLRTFLPLQSINEMEFSHDFHTWEAGPGGIIEICIPPWDASQHLLDLIFEGMLWTKAYEQHLATGHTIHQILRKWLLEHA